MKKCFVCKHTKIKQGFTNRLFDEDGKLIIIKNIPCLICENCHEVYFTTEILTKLEKFLDSITLPEMEIINFERMAA